MWHPRQLLKDVHGELRRNILAGQEQDRERLRTLFQSEIPDTHAKERRRILKNLAAHDEVRLTGEEMHALGMLPHVLKTVRGVRSRLRKHTGMHLVPDPEQPARDPITNFLAVSRLQELLRE